MALALRNDQRQRPLVPPRDLYSFTSEERTMTKRWMLVLLVALMGLPALSGCKVEEEDDDDVELKVDTKGDRKGVEIDAD